MEVGKGPVEELGGDAYLAYLQQDAILNGEFIMDAREMLGSPQDMPETVRPASKGEVVQHVVDWVTLYSSSNSIDLSLDNWMCCMFW